MKPYTCRDCLHYRQHYILWGHCFAPVWCGHCTHPRIKHRPPDKPACPHFVLNETPWYQR